MKHRVTSIAREALKVAVTAWAVLSLDPWVAATFPNIGPGVRYFVSALVAATVLEALLQLVFGWPRIEVRWYDKRDEVAVDSIVARVTKRNPSTQVFAMRVSAPPSGWLGYQVMRALMRTRPTLQVRIERAGVKPTVESASLMNGKPTVVADDESGGFRVDLGSAPRRAGEWHWADVRWRNVSMPPGMEVNVDVLLYHPNPVMRVVLAVAVWRSIRVRRFQVVGA